MSNGHRNKNSLTRVVVKRLPEKLIDTFSFIIMRLFCDLYSDDEKNEMYCSSSRVTSDKLRIQLSTNYYVKINCLTKNNGIAFIEYIKSNYNCLIEAANFRGDLYLYVKIKDILKLWNEFFKKGILNKYLNTARKRPIDISIKEYKDFNDFEKISTFENIIKVNSDDINIYDYTKLEEFTLDIKNVFEKDTLNFCIAKKKDTYIIYQLLQPQFRKNLLQYCKAIRDKFLISPKAIYRLEGKVSEIVIQYEYPIDKLDFFCTLVRLSY